MYQGPGAMTGQTGMWKREEKPSINPIALIFQCCENSVSYALLLLSAYTSGKLQEADLGENCMIWHVRHALSLNGLFNQGWLVALLPQGE